MRGILYGVGVGPGDPELLTIKALRLIEKADVIAVPDSGAKESVALGIVKKMVPKIMEKEILSVPMPMRRETTILEHAHEKGAKELENILDGGKMVVFLTLGDPSVYSTYLYLHQRVVADGYLAEIVPGIPSFCAVAAALSISLGEGEQPIHILPVVGETIEENVRLGGTKIFMKAGKRFELLKKALEKKEGESVFLVENCGMEEEKTVIGVENLPEKAGYFSIIVAKDK